MKQYYYLFLFISLFLFSCEDKDFGDFGGESTFIRFYGTENTDILNEVVELSDNSGYAFVGIINAKTLEDNRELIAGESKLVFTLTDKFGSANITVAYGYSDLGLTDPVDLEAYSMKQTVDGSFIIGGTLVNINDASTKMFLLKLDASGQNPSLKIINEPNANTTGREVTLTSDGGYALIGTVLKDSEVIGNDARLLDFFTIRTEQDQDSIWAYPYGSDSRKNDVGVSIVEADDGGFVWLGTAQNERDDPNTQIRVAGFSSLGHPIWDFMYGGDGIDAAWSITKISEGYIIVGTTSNGSQGGSDIYLVKINNSGGLIDEAFIGTSKDDAGLSIKQTSDNGFIITGTSIDEASGSSDVYLAKVDLLLNLEWDNTFGGEGEDIGFSVIQSSDGGYLIGGISQLETITMMSLIKTDSKGRVADQ